MLEWWSFSKDKGTRYIVAHYKSLLFAERETVMSDYETILMLLHILQSKLHE